MRGRGLITPSYSNTGGLLIGYGFFVCVTFEKFMLKDVKDEVMITARVANAALR